MLSFRNLIKVNFLTVVLSFIILNNDFVNAERAKVKVEKNHKQITSTSTRMQLAQATRRRPGGEEELRRERKDVSKDRIPVATTVEQSKKQEVLYKKEDAQAIPPSDTEFFPVTDRWNMLYKGKWYDPYNQNVLKGDLKLFGTDEKPWFLELTAFSDTLLELRRNPTPVSITSVRDSGRNDIFGNPDQSFLNENIVFQTALIRGNTTFRPPDFEFRFAPVFNTSYVDVEENGVLNVDPARGSHRSYSDASLLNLFVDYHLADISDRYDFVSLRAGVQRFNADFRGLVYNDSQPGVRLFGNWDNNQWQYNLAYFHRLKLDSNSLLPKLFESKDENVVVLNLYRQDATVKGHTVEVVYMYHDDGFGSGERNFDDNGFETAPAAIGNERPKKIRNSYIGLNSDGHIDRLNISSALYWTFGTESNNPITDSKQDINAFLAALELSVDIDWIRPKATFIYASGDGDPSDGDANGFDAIFDNPTLAGGENSYWVRQGIPLIGGGGVALTDRGSFLADLSSGKTQGQSNFVNPGILIYNVGIDVDVTPKLVWENNASYLQFDDTAVLELVRSDGSISRNIGIDVSSAVIYRPLLSNNIQLRSGYAQLLPGQGFKGLYGDKTYYQFFTQAIFLY